MMAASLVIHQWAFLGFYVSFYVVCSYAFRLNQPVSDVAGQEPFTSYDYVRFPEVEKECKTVLSLASKLKPESNRALIIKNEMPFYHGDWVQDSGTMPLMPFELHDNDTQTNYSSSVDPLQLVSFTVTNVNDDHRSQIAVNVSGALSIGISSNGLLSVGSGSSFWSGFQFWPGYSLLTVLFEGVYTESEENGGEHVMCLLGTTSLPSRQPSESAEQWEWVNIGQGNSRQPNLFSDDRILLILHYPKVFTLTSRVIHGVMRSLSEQASPKYFDKISLSSQLGAYSNYQFGSEKLVSKACGPFPYPDELVGDRTKIYKGFGLCELLQRFASGQAFMVVPNWKCNSTSTGEYCSKLGPFQSQKWINETDGRFQNVKLMMQDVRCESRKEQSNVSSARVSAVFRAVPKSEDQGYGNERTGLDGRTLPVEGIWNSATGQLCMVGCTGADEKGCNSHVHLYFSFAFSIKQRNIIFGIMSSIKDGRRSQYFPLSFERTAPIWDLNLDYLSSEISYEYSKTKHAGAFLERNEPFAFSTLIKTSLLRYPKKEESDAGEFGLSNLGEDLMFESTVVPDTLSNVRIERQSIKMEIFTLGPFFMRLAFPQTISMAGGDENPAKLEITEQQLLLNVSAQLTLTGKPYSNVSLLFLEGLYNSINGKMYLIGCRDVRASSKILFDSMDLEDGLDCLIEVKVEYPPTTVRWLVAPMVKISIMSQRNEDDPLYFSPVKIQTLPIMYRRQRQDILSRRAVEGVLRILTLSVAIGCISSQLFYIRDNTSSVPYISLVMLFVQALGYSIPLITGVEALFSSRKSDSYGDVSYDLERNLFYKTIDYLVKFLILAAFLITLRLGQKVWKSRIRLLSRSPLEPTRVPNDKWVLWTCLGIHTIGYFIVLVIHTVNASRRPIQTATYTDSGGNGHEIREWEIVLEEYVGLVQDFFLLPQVIGNILWQLNCEPLRKSYYVSVTIVRILPHIYDYIRAPIVNPYFSGEHEFVDPSLDFYSKFGDIAIPVTTILLSVVIYFQQRWNCQKLCQSLGLGRSRLLSLGSRVYERLPSASFEAELVSGVNDTAVPSQMQKDGD